MSDCRVYICDDSAEYRFLLRTVLTEEGATIVGEARDGRQCLEQAIEEKPDVVLLDLNMPVMDGYEALPLLKAKLPGAKVAVLTTSRSADTRERVRGLGADAFVTKPMDPFDVPRLLREQLVA